MKRLLLGLAVAAAAAGTAAPASAHVTVQYCYATAIYPCGVCVSEAGVSKCTRG